MSNSLARVYSLRCVVSILGLIFAGLWLQDRFAKSKLYSLMVGLKIAAFQVKGSRLVLEKLKAVVAYPPINVINSSLFASYNRISLVDLLLLHDHLLS